MELLSLIGLNVTIIVAIIGICEYIKFKLKGKFKRFYVLLPFLNCIVFAFLMTKPLEPGIEEFNLLIYFQSVALNTLMYFGVCVLFYAIIKNTILQKSGKNLFDSIIKFIKNKKGK